MLAFHAAGVGGVGLRPIAFGPGRRNMLRIAAEFKNVPLRQAQVFEKHPQGVGIANGLLAAESCGNIGDYGIESGVGVASFEK